MSVIDWPIQVELLTKFNLPLLEYGFWSKDQNSLGSPGHPSLAKQKPCFDRFPQPNFVGYEKLGRPLVVHALKRLYLMRPRFNCGRGFSHALCARLIECGSILDVPPQQSASFCGVHPFGVSFSSGLHWLI